jgi:hypothetical protein
LATEIDRGDKTVSASVTHLSDFAVMLDTSSTAEGVCAKLVLWRIITWMGEGDPYAKTSTTSRRRLIADTVPAQFCIRCNRQA